MSLDGSDAEAAKPQRQENEQENGTKSPGLPRSGSFSQQSDTSQTAAEFLRDQMQLEADAREVLPYSIETCTKILGPLRQNVFACLTCTPPPASPHQAFSPAGICYACSVSCHGEHTLVEIFQKRNFTCDCGTSRFANGAPCTIRPNEQTGVRGGVKGELADSNNRYNQNFRNRFCGCECDYDPFQQRGTMFQCLGLGGVEEGGCGEDWWHPGCLVGLGERWEDKTEKRETEKATREVTEGGLEAIKEEGEGGEAEHKQGGGQPDGDEAGNAEDNEEAGDDDDGPMPPGFPNEDDFDAFLCYKCVEANPWIKKYAGTENFLPAVFLNQTRAAEAADGESKKRKAEDSEEANDAKRAKVGISVDSTDRMDTATSAASDTKPETGSATETGSEPCKLLSLPDAPTAPFSLFLKSSFRDSLCRCPPCYRLLSAKHPQLLEEEEAYEPPLSDEAANSEHGGSTQGSGSLYERGESALRNVDRVRAIEGVMAYNHLKEKLKPFFAEFAGSGKVVTAEDVKGYFEMLRGDQEGMREAAGRVREGGEGGEGEGDGRREQSGY